MVNPSQTLEITHTFRNFCANSATSGISSKYPGTCELCEGVPWKLAQQVRHEMLPHSGVAPGWGHGVGALVAQRLHKGGPDDATRPSLFSTIAILVQESFLTSLI